MVLAMAKNRYRPRASWVRKVPPGEILYEYVSCGEFTVQQIAEGLGISIYHTLCLFEGAVRITPILAKKLAMLTGRNANLWLNIQTQYDEAIASEWSRRRMK
jgi:plasmid maintenance system antidote protein VapI